MASRRIRVMLSVAIACLVCVAAAATAFGHGAAHATKASRPVDLWVMEDYGGTAFQTTAYYGDLAAADVLNASGGLDGHKVVLKRCSSKGSVTLATACAQQAVADRNAIAMVGDTLFGSVVDPIVQQAKLPYVGQDYLSGADGTTPDVFPLDPTAAGAAGALVPFYKSGVKPLAIVVGAYGQASEQFAASSSSLLALGTGQTLAGKIEIPPTATDLSSYASQAASGAYGGIWLALGDTVAVTFIRAYEAAGGKASQVVCIASTCTPNFIKGIGAANANGIHLGLTNVPYSANVPGMKALIAALKKYAPTAPSDQLTLTGWAQMQILEDALKGASTLSRAVVLARMAHLTNASTGGLFPPYTTTVPFTGVGGSAPRLYDHDYVYGIIKNGVQTCVGKCKFVNPYLAAG
jgi:ABC-type branched-subunit amino acid transport system substrate-binding protein